MTDLRRRQYVPLSVHFAAGHTGQEIQKRLGLEGLGAWACLLAAAKRSHTQGEFEWVTESEAWRHLLGPGEPPKTFTFTEFVRVLGRLHLTKTTKRGEVKTTSIRAWNEWNTTIRREQDAEKKRRKRAQTTGDNNATSLGTEVEGEGETPHTPPRRRNRPVNGNGRAHLGKHVCTVCGHGFDEAHLLETHLEWSGCSGNYEAVA